MLAQARIRAIDTFGAATVRSGVTMWLPTPFDTAMGREAGWGKDIPDMLRNEDWNYAVFTTAKAQRAGVNQAECLACHKPLDKVSYTFTLKQLADAGKTK